eukprot:16447956-Heterocapsa_arctica.AAC.1
MDRWARDDLRKPFHHQSAGGNCEEEPHSNHQPAGQTGMLQGTLGGETQRMRQLARPKAR